MGLKDCGGLWLKEGKDGKFMAGEIDWSKIGVHDKVKVMVFRNKNKQGKQPDYKIMWVDDGMQRIPPPAEKRKEDPDIPF